MTQYQYIDGKLVEISRTIIYQGIKIHSSPSIEKGNIYVFNVVDLENRTVSSAQKKLNDEIVDLISKAVKRMTNA